MNLGDLNLKIDYVVEDPYNLYGTGIKADLLPTMGKFQITLIRRVVLTPNSNWADCLLVQGHWIKDPRKGIYIARISVEESDPPEGQQPGFELIEIVKNLHPEIFYI